MSREKPVVWYRVDWLYAMLAGALSAEHPTTFELRRGGE
jgi:hypothetical protein